MIDKAVQEKGVERNYGAAGGIAGGYFDLNQKKTRISNRLAIRRRSTSIWIRQITRPRSPRRTSALNL